MIEEQVNIIRVTEVTIVTLRDTETKGEHPGTDQAEIA